MNRAALDSLNREGLVDLILAQAETIERQAAEMAALRAGIAELQAKLNRPPKTPDNSSLPPSQGRKRTEFAKSRGEGNPHQGAHRPLDPSPTQRRDILASVCGHCGADVSRTPQEPREAYDRSEIPPIAPEITRVTLHGGVRPYCAKRFKACAPAGLEPGSPPRVQARGLRAFVIYLRFTQGVAFERLSRLMRDVFGLSISEGALVNILSRARERFAAASAAIRAKLLNGTVICSDETGFAGGKKKLAAVGLSPWRERLLPDPSPPLQAGGRGVPRRRSPGRLGLRSLQRPGRLGGERPATLPRPSQARHPIRH